MQFRLLPMILLAIPLIGTGDDLMPLGDEFNDASSLDRWQRLYEAEGWVVNQLERWDIDAVDADGRMVMMPYTSSWFGNLNGVHVYKEITGDFVITTDFQVRSRHNPTDPLEPPARQFDLAGIFIRSPRSITSAAPTPYTTNAVWTAADHGSDWTPGGENYIFLSFGSAGNPGTRQYEVKTTVNSSSSLYYRNYAVPDDPNVTLQLVRVGQTFLVLRRHPGGDWIIENRYVRDDFPATLHVGLTTYTDWATIGGQYYDNGNLQTQFHHNYLQIADPLPNQPDLEARFDYVRFQRPDSNITAQLLTTLPVTGPNGPVAYLNTTIASNLLGDVANQPLSLLSFTADTFYGSETAGVVEVGLQRSVIDENPLAVDQMEWVESAAQDSIAPPQDIIWTNGESGVKTVLLAVTNDTIAEGTHTSRVIVTRLQGPMTLPGGFLSMTARVEIADSPDDQWRWEQFGTNANSAAGQWTGDWDNDGSPNKWEAAAGTDATVSNLPHKVHIDTNTFQFVPTSTPPQWLSLGVQTNTTISTTNWVTAARRLDNGTWTNLTPDIQVHTTTNQGVRVYFETPGDQNNVRLRVD